MTYHTRVHTKEKPYKCSYCDYSSAQKANLQVHLYSKHFKLVPEINQFLMYPPSSS